jgi:hypothetical protein
MSEPTLVLTLDEARSLWMMLSHDAYGLSDDALRVRDFLRRVRQFIEECDADAVADCDTK